MTNAVEIKAPGKVDWGKPTIFLAGSIEMGLAVNWQYRVVQAIIYHAAKREPTRNQIQVLNPRRDDWDASWEQSIDNPQFKEQVEWELEGLLRADIVIFYFDPATKSPITLMELGLMAGTDPSKIAVICPEGFWRKGNVDILCNKFRIEQFSSLDELFVALEELGE